MASKMQALSIYMNWQRFRTERCGELENKKIYWAAMILSSTLATAIIGITMHMIPLSSIVALIVSIVFFLKRRTELQRRVLETIAEFKSSFPPAEDMVLF